MSRSTIPLAILGGSDRRANPLPPSGQDKRPLTGCKGVDLRLEGEALITIIARTLRGCGFGPIYVAGPKDAYRGVPGIDDLFDTDSGFGTNIRVGIESMRRLHGEGTLAMTTCDILPDTSEVERALDDFRQHAPSDLWFPLAPTPDDQRDLGESEWKPRYRIPTEGAPGDERSSVAVLPSHLAIFNPEAMRLKLLYKLLDSTYSTRNRSVLDRRTLVIRRMFSGILYRDLLNIVRLRLPTLTWDTVVRGGTAALKLHRGNLSLTHLEDAVRRIFVRREHRLEYPAQRIRMPILSVMSLARDIDTLEEASSLGVESAE